MFLSRILCVSLPPSLKSSGEDLKYMYSCIYIYICINAPKTRSAVLDVCAEPSRQLLPGRVTVVGVRGGVRSPPQA